MKLLNRYFRGLYQRTMSRAYGTAYEHIASSLTPDSLVLDCGANNGAAFDQVASRVPFGPAQYRGIEWNARCVSEGRARGLDIVQGDLNQRIPHPDESFSCVYALSVLEHLLYPCRFMRECHRVLRVGGQFVLITPNISTYFTAALILLGRMPSSGPYPDSNELLKRSEVFKVSSHEHGPDTEDDTPVYRHLIVFSFRVLRDYLRIIGFTKVTAYGFGLYPFPNVMQPLLERLDPYHCHQMVFVARK